MMYLEGFFFSQQIGNLYFLTTFLDMDNAIQMTFLLFYFYIFIFYLINLKSKWEEKTVWFLDMQNIRNAKQLLGRHSEYLGE